GGHSTSGPATWVSSSTNFLFTGAQIAADLTQTAANRNSIGVNSAWYKLTYTISNYSYTSGSAELRLLSGSGQ
ncbi:MAG TPA: hypothetical protein DCX27_15600, partial [Balneola sp.]|nr:hypothetical protein [Balneola sp.]